MRDEGYIPIGVKIEEVTGRLQVHCGIEFLVIEAEDGGGGWVEPPDRFAPLNLRRSS